MNDDRYCIRVCAAVLRAGDEILVIRERKRGIDYIDLPGGDPQHHETLENAVIREVAEETGYVVVPTEVAFVAERRVDRWGEATLEMCFYARIDSASEREQRLGENILSVEWMSLYDEALRRDVPYADLFIASKRGRYIDESHAVLGVAQTDHA